MKKQVIVVIGALLLAALFAGCDTPTDSKDSGYKPLVRYETIPYNSSNFGRAGTDSYFLVSSTREFNNSKHYYLYYLGYVKGVPISYKTSYRYDGTTPITIMWEKSALTEQSIMESMTKAKEETWDVNASATLGVELGAKGGLAPFAEASVKTSVSATVGGGYGETISTSNTYETVTTSAYTDTESVTTTVGEHGEPAGRYRYSLFGVTDVFCLFTVNPSNGKIISAEVINTARENTFAWGIDYDPDDIGLYNKTGGGSKFLIPDVDFTQMTPKDTLSQPAPDAVPCPSNCNCKGTNKCGHSPCLCVAPPTCPGDCANCYGTGICGHSPCKCPTPDFTKTVTFSGDINVSDDTTNTASGGPKYDLVTTDFNIQALKAHGKTAFEIKVEFRAKEVDDGWLNVYVRPGHVTSFAVNGSDSWGYSYQEIDPPSSKAWQKYTETLVSQVVMATYGQGPEQQFTIAWDASGSGSDKHIVEGGRKVIVTAKP